MAVTPPVSGSRLRGFIRMGLFPPGRARSTQSMSSMWMKSIWGRLMQAPLLPVWLSDQLPVMTYPRTRSTFLGAQASKPRHDPYPGLSSSVTVRHTSSRNRSVMACVEARPPAEHMRSLAEILDCPEIGHWGILGHAEPPSESGK